MYGWRITKDHLAEKSTDSYDTTGVTGPRGISEETELWLDTEATPAARLPEGIERHVFDMSDDEGTRLMTGVIVWDADDDTEFFEDYLMAPLRDLGTPGAGATRIHYRGHPEWDL